MRSFTITSPVYLEVLAESIGVEVAQIKIDLIRHELLRAPINILADDVAVNICKLYWLRLIVVNDEIELECSKPSNELLYSEHFSNPCKFIFQHIEGAELREYIGKQAFEHAFANARSDLSFVDVVYGILAAYDRYRLLDIIEGNKDAQIEDHIFDILCNKEIRDGVREWYTHSDELNEVKKRLENMIGEDL